MSWERVVLSDENRSNRYRFVTRIAEIMINFSLEGDTRVQHSFPPPMHRRFIATD